MSDILYGLVLVVLVGSRAVLAARADHWRDARWMGVLALIAVTVVVAVTGAKILPA